MKHHIGLVTVVLLTLTGVCLSAPATLPVRQAKYPPKTARTLHSDAEIARARENVKRYPAAAKIAADAIRNADRWVECSDKDLVFLLTSPDVPRAFAVGTAGCPQCGHKINEKGGDYAWIIDPKLPFKVKCPVDGSVWPTNDFERYYRSGFVEQAGWDSSHVDDGWGWTDPKTGEKYWFVAYFNHWMWHRHLVPGLRDLSRAYLLTGEKRYAHKAGVMLRRIAQVYPGMDHAKQSRYGAMMAARGINYSGKVVNHIWETGLAHAVAEAYDNVFDTLDEADRAFIDVNFIEDAIDACFDGRIRGNFGMHQSALVCLAQVRQAGKTDKWLDDLMNRNASVPAMLGLNYALYNLVYRDGLPSESSPGYNFLWVSKISAYGDLLQRAGLDVFGSGRARRLYDGVLDQVNIGKFTPSVGDSGNVYGALIGQSAETFQTAWRYYQDPRYAALLGELNATGEKSFTSFESLFREPIDVPADAKTPTAKSRLLDGYGMAILNNAADDISMSLYYGQKHGHGHYDRLNFELFAHGQPIMPDLGYPDSMNDFVPGIYTWTKSTIAHNTVVVDAKRQSGNFPGEVKLFADSPFARVVDVEARQTYPQCSTYRRAVIMVDVGQGQSYFVDIFTVAGGRQHDYSLHGPPGEFEMIGGDWTEPAKGTLAGENVEIEQIYDDPEMAAPEYKGGYSTYAGSGFQHLFNVRTQKDWDWVAQWKHEKDSASMLRIRMIHPPGQVVMLCDARVSPVKHPQVLKYLIARRKGEKLASRFVSVIEPFREKAFIKSIGNIEVREGDGVALRVFHEDDTSDIIVYNPSGAILRTAYLSTDVKLAVNRYGRGSKPLDSVRMGGTVRSKSWPHALITGEVTQVYPLVGGVVMKADELWMMHDVDRLVGRIVHFRNDRHRTAHMIEAVERQDDFTVLLKLRDDLPVGLAKIDQVEPDRLVTSTALPLAPTYHGVTLADEMFRFQHPVASVADGTIVLASPLPSQHPLKAGDNVWLMDVGVGDAVEIPSIRYQLAK